MNVTDLNIGLNSAIGEVKGAGSKKTIVTAETIQNDAVTKVLETHEQMIRQQNNSNNLNYRNSEER